MYSVEMWATLASALIGLIVLILNHRKEMSPGRPVAQRLDEHEARISDLEKWRRHE